jgi:hypothetical protein
MHSSPPHLHTKCHARGSQFVTCLSGHRTGVVLDDRLLFSLHPSSKRNTSLYYFSAAPPRQVIRRPEPYPMNLQATLESFCLIAVLHLICFDLSAGFTSEALCFFSKSTRSLSPCIKSRPARYQFSFSRRRNNKVPSETN